LIPALDSVLKIISNGFVLELLLLDVVLLLDVLELVLELESEEDSA
jgi:hypothetical protein